MQRLVWITGASVVLLVLGAGQVAAQGFYSGGYTPFQPPVFSPGARPGLSPYLNLLRGGNPAANYYLGVLPELDRRANDVQFRSALLNLDRRVTLNTLAEEGDLLRDRPLPSTGHAVGFMTYGTYYNLGFLSRFGPGVAPTTSNLPPPRRSR
jgi:hypothetical protein